MTTHDDARPDEIVLGRALARISELNSRIESQAAASRQRHGVLVAVVALMALIMSFGLSQMVALADSLDVDTVAYMGRMEAENRLPDGRLALQDALEEQAPDIVAAALRSALDSVPAARGMMVQHLNQQLDGIHDEFEDQTVRLVGETVRMARPTIEAAYPHSSLHDKELLVARAAAQSVSEGFRSALAELYPSYAGRMRQMAVHMERLAVTPVDQLTDRERNQRDLIETMIQLSARAER
jgi:hypothetical protein